MKGHRSSVNLIEALRASQDLHVTRVFSFPNTNKKCVLINPSRLIGQSGKGLNMEFLHVGDKPEKDTCNSNRYSNATKVNDLVTFIMTFMLKIVFFTMFR